MSGATVIRLFLAALAIGRVSAFTFAPVDDGILADTADCIFVAEVLAVNDVFKHKITRAATSIWLRVSDVVKYSHPDGEAEKGSRGRLKAGEEVVVSVPGGYDPEADLRLTVPGAPVFVVGERVLLFAHHHEIENASLPLLGHEDGLARHLAVSHVALGAFKEHQAAGTHVRSLGQRTFAVNPTADPTSISDRKVRDFAGFVEYLRSRVAAAAAAQKRSRPIAAHYWVSQLSINETEPVVSAPRQKRWATFEGEPRWCDFATTSTNWRHTEGGQPSYSPTAVYAGGALTEMTQAMDLFNNFAGVKVAYVLAGTTTSTAGFTRSDGINGIIYNDPNNEIGSAFSCDSGGVLAIGGAWSQGSCTFKSRTHSKNVEGDVIMNAGIGCTFITLTSLAELYAHELGHSLGFAHSSVANALMFSTLHNDGRGAAMDADDEQILAYLYESASAGTLSECTATAAGNITNGGCGGTAWTFGASLATTTLNSNSLSDCLQIQDLSNVVCDIPTGSIINRIDVSVTLTAGSQNKWTLTSLGLIGSAGRYPSTVITGGSIGTTSTEVFLSGDDAFWLLNEPAGSLSDSSKFTYGSKFGFWFEISSRFGGQPVAGTFNALSVTINYAPPVLTTGSSIGSGSSTTPLTSGIAAGSSTLVAASSTAGVTSIASSTDATTAASTIGGDSSSGTFDASSSTFSGGDSSSGTFGASSSTFSGSLSTVSTSSSAASSTASRIADDPAGSSSDVPLFPFLVALVVVVFLLILFVVFMINRRSQAHDDEDGAELGQRSVTSDSYLSESAVTASLS